LVYTPGHAGVSLDERADQLARMASASHSSSEKTYRKPALKAAMPSARGG
jgi:ribonuclease HI